MGPRREKRVGGRSIEQSCSRPLQFGTSRVLSITRPPGQAAKPSGESLTPTPTAVRPLRYAGGRRRRVADRLRAGRDGGAADPLAWRLRLRSSFVAPTDRGAVRPVRRRRLGRPRLRPLGGPARGVRHGWVRRLPRRVRRPARPRPSARARTVVRRRPRPGALPPSPFGAPQSDPRRCLRRLGGLAAARRGGARRRARPRRARPSARAVDPRLPARDAHRDGAASPPDRRDTEAPGTV